MKQERMAFSRRAALLVCLLSACAGCSTFSRQTRVSELSIPREPEQYVRGEEAGASQYIWEEPMIDVVEVPPGLDPEGHYYRPAHQEIREIRQGRWEYYKEQ